ncbi:MAG: ribonuclease III [Phycisphaeraceae bacterium]|nr:ribonuclease III [Phycisphaeraceae bacterium]
MHERVQQILGYEFQNASLLNEALTHASIAGHRLESNERMEFLGDAILGAVVSDYLFRNYPTYLEGDLTKIKSAVVSRKSCARVSEALELQTMLSLGKGMAGREVLPSSIAAAVFESIIAAIYLDGGMEPARAFILRHMTPIIQETAASAHQQNFKSMLQHHAQKSLPGNPIYVVLDEKGPDHSKCFEVCVEIDGRRYGSAWAASKKEAEQKAAQLALRDLGVLWDQESTEGTGEPGEDDAGDDDEPAPTPSEDHRTA